MIDFEKLTPGRIVDAVRGAMRALRRAVAAIVATPAAERTFANTFVALESAADSVGQASGNYAFMAYVAADDDTPRDGARVGREARASTPSSWASARTCTRPISDYAATPEAAALDGEEQRLLERTLRDYRRNGFELPKEQREQVQALMNRLVELGHGVPQGDRQLGRRASSSSARTSPACPIAGSTG